jgi:hypothetical protein
LRQLADHFRIGLLVVHEMRGAISPLHEGIAELPVGESCGMAHEILHRHGPVRGFEG